MALEHLHDEVRAWDQHEQAMRARGLDPLRDRIPPEFDGGDARLREDALMFEQVIDQENPNCKRKATNKKAKKLFASLCNVSCCGQ